MGPTGPESLYNPMTDVGFQFICGDARPASKPFWRFLPYGTFSTAAHLTPICFGASWARSLWISVLRATALPRYRMPWRPLFSPFSAGIHGDSQPNPPEV